MNNFFSICVYLAAFSGLLSLLSNQALVAAEPPSHDDLVYATVTKHGGSSMELHLDLWLPSDNRQPAPLVIWIHGGAWLAGSYNHPPAPLNELLAEGFAVASIQYRFSQQAIAPAQIHDVKGAVRYLRAHAEQYELDSEKFAAWGESAGGHLAALLATTGEMEEAKGTVGGNQQVSSQVQAVVDYFGPTDLLTMNSEFEEPELSALDHDAPDSPESRLIGFDQPGEGIGKLRDNRESSESRTAEKVKLVALMNPLTHVTADDPPFFIAHGNEDPIVPLRQSQRLAEALRAVGVEHNLVVVDGGGHGFGAQAAEVHEAATGFLQEVFNK